MVDKIIQSLDIWTDAQGLKSKGRVKSVDNISLEGIARLRELILELAVRGKLVPQDPNDEPASDLLRKITKEKERLIKDGKIKKTTSKKNERESSFSIPKNWVIARLSQVFDVRDGTHDSPKLREIGYPLVTSKNLSSGKLDLSDVNYISEVDHLKIIERSKVDKGDVLFAMIGSIGNPVIVDTDIEFSIKNVALFKYYNKEFSSEGYLQLFLKMAAVEMRKIALGGVQSFVSLGLLRDFEIPLPPLAEQHRIVSKVDELLALCDKLETQQTDNLKTHEALVKTLLETLTQAANADELQTAWARLSTHFDTLFCTENSIDQLKQTILQLAVMGKLVKQNPNDEPASELLKKIAKEKEKLVKEGKIKKQEKLPEIGEDEKPFELPINWNWTRLGEITIINPRNNIENDTVVSFIPMNLITASYTGKHDSEERKWSEIKKGFTHFADGDIGIAKITPCFENSKAVVFSNLKNGIGAGTTELHIARPYGKTLHARFVLFNLKTPEYLKNGELKMTGTAGQKRLPKSFFAEYPFPLPPLEEQNRIVSKVDELFSLCDTLKEKLIQAQEIKGLLAKAVVEGAVG